MALTSLGDLARSFTIRHRQGDLKQQIDRHGTELATGRTADLAGTLRGDYSALTDIQRGRGLNAGYSHALSEAAITTGAMQSALGMMQEDAQRLSGAILQVGQGGISAAAETLAAEGRMVFEAAVSALNTRVGGRSLFAGVETGGAALAPAADILNALRAEVAGESTAAGMQARVAGFFAPGGGFDSMGYLGADSGPTPIQLAPGEALHLDLRGDDPALREVLGQVALAALAAEAGSPLAPAAAAQVVAEAGQALLAAQDGLTGLRAGLGAAEARIERVQTRTNAQTAALDMAENGLLSVDGYAAATRLEEARFQLEALYAVTARVSGLRLVDFLR